MDDPVDSLREALSAPGAAPAAPSSFGQNQYRGLRITQAPPLPASIDPLVRAALESVGFPERQAMIPLPEELTPPQREVVELIRDRAELGVHAFAIPTSAWCRRRWLGVDAGGALERIGPSGEPLWRTLCRAGTAAPELLGTLPVAERLEALGELVLGAYRLDGNRFGFSSLAELADQGRLWAPRYADRWLLLVRPEVPSGERDGRVELPLTIRFPLFLSLVRGQVPIEPRWDSLLPVATKGLFLAPTLECLRALPEPRRTSALVAALGRQLDRPAIEMGFDLLPYARSAALVLLLLDRADGSIGTLYIPPRRSLLSQLRSACAGEPALLALVEEREASWPPPHSLTAREGALLHPQLEATGWDPAGDLEYLQRHELFDAGGARVCDVVLSMEEDGQIFAPDGTDPIGRVCQGVIECGDPRLKEGLHGALQWRSAR